MVRANSGKKTKNMRDIRMAWVLRQLSVGSTTEDVGLELPPPVLGLWLASGTETLCVAAVELLAVDADPEPVEEGDDEGLPDEAEDGADEGLDDD